MWPDNETTVDLIGFQRFADAITELVADDRLLPLTVGVYGGWGSGKSSVMRMAQSSLLQDEDMVCVWFNGWVFQGYDDAKAALVTEVLDTLQKHQKFGEKVKKGAQRLLSMVDWMRAMGLLSKHVVTLSLPSLEEFIEVLKKPSDEEVATAAGQFRHEFQELLEKVSIDRLVVFIDDLDRCLPPSIVDTLEVIRLFLAVPYTAFVIGAEERVIRAAISSRYPTTEGMDWGRNYLEKMIQISLSLPPLNEAETQTYMNLLFSQIRLSEEEFGELLSTASRNRKLWGHELAISWTHVKEMLAECESDKLHQLERDFSLIARIAPVLCQGMQGNPRQTKRFLNVLLLRQRIAKSTLLDCDVDTLAKLLILEYFHPDQFAQLHRWQAAARGRPPELVALELEATEAESEVLKTALTDTDRQIWLESERLSSWLKMEPKLSEVDLSSYFFLARAETVALSRPARHLSRQQLSLLRKLTSGSDSERRNAVPDALALEETELEDLFIALLDTFTRTPDKKGVIESVFAIVGQKDSLMPLLLKTIAGIPGQSITPGLIPRMEVLYNTSSHKSEIENLMQGLTQSTKAPVAKAAEITLERMLDRKGKG